MGKKHFKAEEKRRKKSVQIEIVANTDFDIMKA